MGWKTDVSVVLCWKIMIVYDEFRHENRKQFSTKGASIINITEGINEWNKTGKI